MRKLTGRGAARALYCADRKFGHQWKLGQLRNWQGLLGSHRACQCTQLLTNVRKPPGTSRVQGPGPSRTASNTSSNRGSNDHRHGEET